jgi:hypothetical protein
MTICSIGWPLRNNGSPGARSTGRAPSNSAARADLRFVHLSRHLETPGLLTPDQIARYAALRGYADGDRCADVPAGHDPAMWRRHNGCD